MDCLESVKWAHEIVVVDSFSQDNTVELAQNYTSKIIQRPFPGHIEQKNFAIEQASHCWILSIDADERVSPKLKESILKILSQEEISEKGFEVLRLNDYLGEWAYYGGFYPDYKIRLFHRDFGKWGGVNPHDHILLQGPLGRLEGPLYHYTYRDFSHHVEVVHKFTTIAAEEMYKKRKKWPLLKACTHSLGRFLDAYFLKKGFLYGSRGFLLSVMHGIYGFLKYAKLWDLYRKEKKQR
ncbi:MAG: glycosyltransferase family 2 protein [Planctomycetota bacterium]|nr:MAG: glycosyltransferase family 2 protein [Planctomycetota bacterium]